MPQRKTTIEDPDTEVRTEHLRKALDPREKLPIRLRLQLLKAFRGGKVDEATQKVDEAVLRNTVGLGQHLLQSHKDLKEQIKLLTSPPFFPATFLGPAGEARVRVTCNGDERIVNIDAAYDPNPGDSILLNGDRTIVIGPCEETVPLVGDTASFVQETSGGRIVVQFRGENLVCLPVNGLGLATDSLRKGDLLLIDPATKLAHERVTEPEDAHLSFEVQEAISVTPADVGGLDEELDQLLWTIMVGIEHEEAAVRHRLSGFKSVLLSGPPGGGKTLLARTAAGQLQRITGNKTHFLTVAPSEWRSSYVGSSEASVRAFFRSVRALTAKGAHCVIFIDEVESLARARGSHVNAWRDDITNAVLVELDGFSSSGMNNVTIISATNRPDLMDGALRSRLGAKEIRVPGPRRMKAGRAILQVHLREDDPWASEETREEAIETVLSLLYSPAGEYSAISKISFNDGSMREVPPRELLSGRLLKQLCENARHRNLRREIDGKKDGMCVEDLVEATEEMLENMSTYLTRDSVNTLIDLPQDLSVVAVEPIVPPHRRHKQPR